MPALAKSPNRSRKIKNPDLKTLFTTFGNVAKSCKWILKIKIKS